MRLHGQRDGRAHLHLPGGLLQPEADERGQGVVQQQQNPRVDKVVPVEVRVLVELPRARAVDSDEGGDAKQSAGRGRRGRETERRRGEEWDIIPGVEPGSQRTPWNAPMRASFPSKGNATKSFVVYAMRRECSQCALVQSTVDCMFLIAASGLHRMPTSYLRFSWFREQISLLRPAGIIRCIMTVSQPSVLVIITHFTAWHLRKICFTAALKTRTKGLRRGDGFSR